MKKKVILSIAFVISLSPMLLNQYGGFRGVQEITGLINLLNPLGITSVILFFSSVWLPFSQKIFRRTLCVSGAAGIVLSEIYKFFTWHVLTITGELSFQNSLRFAFPEFYLGLAVSSAMIAVYFVIEKIELR